eukprot:756080-Hanusia_phi.AAC.3
MAIDGEPLLGRSMEFAASLITGEIGTQVRRWVEDAERCRGRRVVVTALHLLFSKFHPATLTCLQVNLTLLRYDEWVQTFNEDGELVEESQADQAYLIEVILERIELSH